MPSPTQWHEFEQNLGVSEDRVAWRAIVHGIPKSQTSLAKPANLPDFIN